MVPYQMNLAKGRVLPLATRKRWRCWFMVYLLLVVVVLGWSVGTLSRKCFELFHQEQRISVMERTFLSKRPGSGSIENHLGKLSRKMTACESQLAAMDRFSKKECHAAAIILGLANVMPAGMELSQVTIDNAAATLGVEVYLPSETKGDEAVTPPRLIALWNAEPLLAGRVNHFTSEKSERVKTGGSDVLRWRFSATLLGATR